MHRKQEVGRIALRVEGDWWNGYWVPEQNSMAGAVHLASVTLNAAYDPKVKQAFIDLMKSIFSSATKEAFGLEASFDPPKTAPRE